MRVWSWILVGWLVVGAAASDAEPTVHTLAYAPAPLDNPLKGLVPYAGNRIHGFPHSMEFSYLPLSALVTGEDRYDWQPLERLLEAVAGRGHQTIFRVYLEYPGKSSAIPEYLLDRGLTVHAWEHEGQPILTPDYGDTNLRRCLSRFIAALGKRYDADPRVAYITAGLLGKWGEWHTHPRTDLWADKRVQREVMDAYETAFRVTPILYRYPAGPDAPTAAENASRPVGYHDDSFAWATLDTGRAQDAWYFLSLLRKAGDGARNKWRTQPIGGEIRPEAWGRVFDPSPDHPAIQDFARCVEATHVTWLMDSGMFGGNRGSELRRSRAEAQVGRMGYALHVPRVAWQIAEGSLQVQVDLENRGVAPFYQDWPVEFALIAGGEAVRRYAGTHSVRGLLPGDAPRRWQETFDLTGIRPGIYTLALRMPNPMPGGHPLRFANQTQSRDPSAWFLLATLETE